MLEAKFWEDDEKRFHADAIRKDLDTQIFSR